MFNRALDHPELAALFARWQEITRLERQELEQENWVGLSRHQASKRALMPLFTKALNEWRASFADPAAAARAEREQLQPLAAELAEGERRNQQILRDSQAKVQTSLATLNQSSRTLKGVQRAYGSFATESRWRFTG